MIKRIIPTSYYIDTDTHCVYRVKGGAIVKISTNATFAVYADGRRRQTSVARALYCALNEIDIFSLPRDRRLFFTLDGGKPTVTDASLWARRVAEVRLSRSPHYEVCRQTMAALEAYYNGDNTPLLMLIKSEQELAAKWLAKSTRYSWTTESIDTYLTLAADKLLDRIDEGHPVMGIASWLKRSAENLRGNYQRKIKSDNNI